MLVKKSLHGQQYHQIWHCHNILLSFRPHYYVNKSTVQLYTTYSKKNLRLLFPIIRIYTIHLVHNVVHWYTCRICVDSIDSVPCFTSLFCSMCSYTIVPVTKNLTTALFINMIYGQLPTVTMTTIFFKADFEISSVLLSIVIADQTFFKNSKKKINTKQATFQHNGYIVELFKRQLSKVKVN